MKFVISLTTSFGPCGVVGRRELTTTYSTSLAVECTGEPKATKRLTEHGRTSYSKLRIAP